MGPWAGFPAPVTRCSHHRRYDADQVSTGLVRDPPGCTFVTRRAPPALPGAVYTIHEARHRMASEPWANQALNLKRELNDWTAPSDRLALHRMIAGCARWPVELHGCPSQPCSARPTLGYTRSRPFQERTDPGDLLQ